MKMVRKFIVGAILVVSTAFLTLALRPIPKATWKNSSKLTAQVLKIAEKGGPADITFTFKNDDNFYYINRGRESGLDANELNELLQHREVTVYYSNHWTPMDMKNQSRHITRVELGEKVIYNEIEH